MAILICHAAIAAISISLFIGTLRIKNGSIPKPSLSSSRNLDFPDDFHFWN